VHDDLDFEHLLSLGLYPRGGVARNQQSSQFHEELVVFALLMNPMPPLIVRTTGTRSHESKGDKRR
jgi:hypothetical protein